jgi:hypothetical protein
MRTPARTPAAGGGNRIMQEAQNLRMLQQGQGPLLGGENPELHPSDFTGVTPRSAPSQTPNPLAAAAAAAGGATPSVHGGPSVAGVSATPQLTGATPGRGGTSVAGISATPLLGATPGRGGGLPSATPTPMRDALGLNDPDTFAAGAGGSSKREEAARLALQRNELRAGLSQLPAPRNEYQIVVPDMPGGWVNGLLKRKLCCEEQGAHAVCCAVGQPEPANGKPAAPAATIHCSSRHLPTTCLLFRTLCPALQRRRLLGTALRRMQRTGRRGAGLPQRRPAWLSCASALK